MNNYKGANIIQASSSYPAIRQSTSPILENRINKLIREEALSMLATERYRNMNIISAASKYDITVNKNEILSIRLENYYYPENMANGITIVKGITINLITGRSYRLKDLFKKNSNFKEYIDRILIHQIEENDIPLIEEYPGISGREEFYLTEDSLVIIYQEYQLTPGYYGTLEFNIPYTEIIPIINENGPIANLTR